MAQQGPGRRGASGQGPGARGQGRRVIMVNGFFNVLVCGKLLPPPEDVFMSIRSYEDLEVWQKSMDFVVDCYKTTGRFPPDERYALTNQLRRAAVSIPSNIAEGHGRAHTKEFIKHLSIAYGSLMEAESQLRISQRLGYLPTADAAALLEASANIGRMLNGLRAALSRRLVS